MKKLGKNKVIEILGIGVFIVVMTILLYQISVNISILVIAFFFLYYLKILRKKRESTFLSLTFLFVLALTVFFWQKEFDFSPYLSGLITLVLLVNILFNDIEFSFAYLFFINILNTLVFNSDFKLFLIYLVSGATAIFLSRNVRKRFDVIKAGFLAGIMEFLMIISVSSLFKYPELVESFKSSLINGIVSSVIVLGILPIFEYLLGVVTNISLLELSDFNHPLLRRLILEAPGTYQHSLIVANLAESAAEAIGANSILTRVGAYYHDIGKIFKAEYFSENQMLAQYRDKHKNLSPAMSKLIIMKHVKEGVELAKKYHLNKKIIDFIAQHHGTTLVYYFFKRAQQTPLQTVSSEESYRYPGPKPKSKEVALVHLADTVEATSRTLEDPNPSQIKEMVRTAILDKFLDGQLDETDLTLKDLEKIGEVFTRILNAMFHTRINYSKSSDEDSSKKSSKNTQNK
ncbi:MAG: HDIG domain-containing protein [Candidatus Omnitrophica bacterium]|nr:HDIG domain-containing protein [Candidatus Omnitrophota bacterium]